MTLGRILSATGSPSVGWRDCEFWSCVQRKPSRPRGHCNWTCLNPKAISTNTKRSLAERRVFVNDEEIKLTKLEFDLLAMLVRNPRQVLTHRYPLKEVWGPHAVDEPHYVRVFMANLRTELERDSSRPEYLLTEQGVGYRLKEE